MTTEPRGTGARRTGYAPANMTVGRRGMFTRERIVESAADLFATNGFHGTSVDDIARSVGGSRALVYQYFPNKDVIFGELVQVCEPVVIAHGHELGGIGPDIAGMSRLRDWLHEWERLYDRFAAVFLEFPGIGPVSGRNHDDVYMLSGHYTQVIADQLNAAGVAGLASGEAAAAMLRIAHMTYLYRYRKIFDLPTGDAFSDSLTVVIQRLLFPATPASVIETVIPAHAHSIPQRNNEFTPPPVDTEPALTKREILTAGAALFTKHGYYAVSMPDIRAAAGISRATLYRYFSTKMDILAELSRAAVYEGAHLAGQVTEMSQDEFDPAAIHAWLCRYVKFHRRYGGVIRAWYDGTLREQLATAVGDGVAPFHQAALSLLLRVGIPARVDPAVATAVVLSVLGRMSDLAVGLDDERTDTDTANFILTVLRRSVLAERHV